MAALKTAFAGSASTPGRRFADTPPRRALAKLVLLERERDAAISLAQTCSKRCKRLVGRVQHLQQYAMERMLVGDEVAARETLKTKLQVQGTLDLTVARAQNNYSLAARLQDLVGSLQQELSDVYGSWPPLPYPLSDAVPSPSLCQGQESEGQHQLGGAAAHEHDHEAAQVRGNAESLAEPRQALPAPDAQGHGYVTVGPSEGEGAVGHGTHAAGPQEPVQAPLQQEELGAAHGRGAALSAEGEGGEDAGVERDEGRQGEALAEGAACEGVDPAMPCVSSDRSAVGWTSVSLSSMASLDAGEAEPGLSAEEDSELAALLNQALAPGTQLPTRNVVPAGTGDSLPTPPTGTSHQGHQGVGDWDAMQHEVIGGSPETAAYTGDGGEPPATSASGASSVCGGHPAGTSQLEIQRDVDWQHLRQLVAAAGQVGRGANEHPDAVLEELDAAIAVLRDSMNH
ncbi:hypothetical protein V8C86DRAFT_2702717 [Haematococcus lacustris]